MRSSTPLFVIGGLFAVLAAAGCTSQGDTSAQVAGGECAAPQGVTADTIKIGSTWPLTGAAAVGALGSKSGTEAAFKEVNESGGVNGRRIELVSYDDAFEAARSVANIRRLVDSDRVYAIFGPSGSANIPGSYDYIGNKGIPLFAPILPPDPHLQEVYLLGTSHTDQARIIVDKLSDMGVKSVAVIRQDNDLGAEILAGVKTQAKSRGLSVVADEVLEPNSPKVGTAVANARSSKADAVVSGGDNAQTGLILKTASEMGWDVPIFGDSTTGSPGSTNTVGSAGKAAEGFYATAIASFPDDDTKAVAKYREAMEKYNPGQINNSYALINYANAQVFLEILKKINDKLCWNNFSDTAEQLKDYETNLIPSVSFGPLPDGHVGTRGAMVTQYVGGKWTVVSDGFVEPK